MGLCTLRRARSLWVPPTKRLFCVHVLRDFWNRDFFTTTEKLPTAYSAIVEWVAEIESSDEFYCHRNGVYYTFYFLASEPYYKLSSKFQKIHNSPPANTIQHPYRMSYHVYRMHDYAGLLKSLGYDFTFTDNRTPPEREFSRFSMDFLDPQKNNKRTAFWVSRKHRSRTP